MRSSISRVSERALSCSGVVKLQVESSHMERHLAASAESKDFKNAGPTSAVSASGPKRRARKDSFEKIGVKEGAALPKEGEPGRMNAGCG